MESGQEREIMEQVEKLVKFGRVAFSLSDEDEMVARNALLAELKLKEPFDEKKIDMSEIEKIETPDILLKPLSNWAVEKKIIGEEERNLFETKMMGFLLPAPSIIIEKFNRDAANQGTKVALRKFYESCIRSNYIKINDVRKNIEWVAKASKGDLIITINLSKPEKDNKEIARLKALPASGYPKCMLCFENIGYSGRSDFPARQTLRFLPLTLNNERWYMQYSPYVYYNEHCIVFSKEHRPMKIDDSTFIKLFEFVDQFPSYFIGSNACLPIVGGSILTHEHFQGGGYEMPMHRAGNRKTFKSPIEGVEIAIADWYNSVIRISSASQKAIIQMAIRINDCWKDYSDVSVDILAQTKEKHNTITPIARKIDGKYSMDIILRNNRTNSTYPDGIFHAHPEHHNIKKEGIGLIEVMGLFILPGRLQKQCELIADILCGTSMDISSLSNEQNSLYDHRNMVQTLIQRVGIGNSQSNAKNAIREYINETCIDILKNTAVFKEDEQGQKAFERFMNIVINK